MSTINFNDERNGVVVDESIAERACSAIIEQVQVEEIVESQKEPIDYSQETAAGESQPRDASPANDNIPVVVAAVASDKPPQDGDHLDGGNHRAGGDEGQNSQDRRETDESGEPPIKKRKMEFKKDLPSTSSLITLKTQRLWNFKINHKRSIYHDTEALEIQKMRIGAQLQYVGPIRVSQLQWMKIAHRYILESIPDVTVGEDIKFPLGDDLFVAISEYEGMKVVHIRYYYTLDNGQSYMASKNGISIAAHKYNELAQNIFNFDLDGKEEMLKKKLLVGQIVQNNIRKRLTEIERERGLPTGISTAEFFLKRHLKGVLVDMERDMNDVYQMYDKVARYIDYPQISGRVVVCHFYNDEMKNDIIHLLDVNEDYHSGNQMIIECIEDRENAA